MAAVTQRRTLLLTYLRLPAAAPTPAQAARWALMVSRGVLAAPLDTLDEVLVTIDHVHREVVPLLEDAVADLDGEKFAEAVDPKPLTPEAADAVRKVAWAGFLVLMDRLLREKFGVTKEKAATYDPASDKSAATHPDPVDPAPLAEFAQLFKGPVEALLKNLAIMVGQDADVLVAQAFKRKKAERARKTKAPRAVEGRGKRARRGTGSDDEYVE